ncbi:UDP-galactopyranose mutase [Vandammella animalimorsus]|uniref:UDP-galactopyranose mutase n=1 Tax=Vandammella animalimorsus TaxID=2029117 RepID=A0A2A2AFP1_9BURK|nr:UDP-galactopyranose mutase [Vandammella animalimorsus]PAT36626.1 UDP-galactopyranose mutase [Vandammella animalimorsus]
MYDYLIVGAGMFGATFARLATDAGKRCLVIDQRPHIAGNCYTEHIDGIHVHRYGPHIFHCNDEKIWAFVQRFAQFNNFRNAPIAMHGGKAYSLPFNMYTFNQIWGVTTPEQARARIEAQRLRLGREPANLEEQALSLVGRDIYETLIRDYTRKQWQKDPKELPAAIIKRLPLRWTWDNNYFNDRYQGIPVGGYTALFERMLQGIEVRLNTDYLAERSALDALARHTVFTGRIDAFYGYRFGELEYRTLRFDTEWLDTDNHQGNAVVNYTEASVPWTRIVEHKHFEPGNTSARTCITREIPDTWSRDKVPYYPIGDAANMALFARYEALAEREPRVLFGGRLAEYRYYDMHQVIGSARAKAEKLLRAA